MTEELGSKRIMMTTFTGRRVDPYHMTASDIYVEDIAHALSLLCRFGGHSRVFYSVAQHSVRVARSLPKEMMLEGLLHDATEAYIQDMVRPVKHRMPQYKALEKLLWRSIAFKYDFNPEGHPFEVGQIDNCALKSELRQFVNGCADELSLPFWNAYDELPPVDSAWSPGEAEGMFMMTYADALAERATWLKEHTSVCRNCINDECQPSCIYFGKAFKVN